MLKQIKQDFIFGVRLPRDVDMDVKALCQKYELDYLCPGEYEGGEGVIVGVKIDKRGVVVEEGGGQCCCHPFSIEAFLVRYHEAMKRLNGETWRDFQNEYGSWIGEDVRPVLWTVSYSE